MTSCASTASTSKTGQDTSRSKSCDTVCTNSSCYFKKRKQVLPYNLRTTPPKQTGNVVRQRVLSAKLQKVRSLQSQLNDANFHLAEIIRENQALKNLQKRQDKALNRYESSNADLPRLLHKHEEEIRALTVKNKTLKKSLKDTSLALKLKEEELTRAKEQLQHLESLNKDKRLTEREKLVEKVEDLQISLKKSEDQVTQLNKRLLLESKNAKYRLNAEIVKNKQYQRDILNAMSEIERLNRLIESRELSPSKRNRFAKTNRQTMSMVQLNGGEMKAPVSDVKLEPIHTKFKEDYKPSVLMKPPTESIKSRLSSGSVKSVGKNKSSENLLKECEEEDQIDLDQGNVERSKSEEDILLDEVIRKAQHRRSLERISLDGNQSLKNFTEFDKKESSNNINQKLMEFTKDVERFKKYNKNGFYKIPKENKSEKDNDSCDEEIESNDKRHNGDYTDLSEEIENIEKTLEAKGQKVQIKREELLLQRTDEEDEEIENMLEKLQTDYNDDAASLDSDCATDKKFSALSNHIDSVIQKSAKNGTDQFDKKLGSYCNSVLTDVKKCDNKIRTHKTSIKMYKQDTDKIVEVFTETKNLEEQIKKTFLANEDDLDIFKDILIEKKSEEKDKKSVSQTTRQPRVSIHDKDKLLATLRAIDNGDNLDKTDNIQSVN